MSSHTQAELRRIVIDLSVCAQRDPWIDHHFQVPDLPHIFVKYGSLNLLAEARTLQYLHALASQSSTVQGGEGEGEAPRVPQMLDSFSDPKGIGYLLMEYVPLPALTLDVWEQDGSSPEERQRRADICITKVSAIVSWLHACPLPPNAGIGPIGGGIILHDFFADRMAPMEFSTVAALEIYVNKAFSRLPRQPKKPTRSLTLSEYRLQLCHSDIKKENFLIDPITLDVWLIDSEHISILPEPFASYALHATRDQFVVAVAAQTNLDRSRHLNDLVFAAGLLQQSGDKSLGLDGYGRQKPRVARRPRVNNEAEWAAWASPVQAGP